MGRAGGESGRSLARQLSLEVYLPLLFAQLGRGMLLPIVPLYLRDAGLSFTMTSVVIGALGLGGIVGGLPVGRVAGRAGPEVLFVAATTAMAVTAALLGVATAVLALVAFRAVYGIGAVGLRVSVQMLVHAAAPVHLRGRGMSAIGGTVRLAFFVGPLIGGVLVDLAGFTTAFAACGLATLASLPSFLAIRRRRDAGARLVRPAEPLRSLRHALAAHRGVLLLAGFGATLVMTVREGRHVVVPLIGDELGLSATAVGALVAIGTGADLLLFPVSGWLMDHFGRLHAIVPAFSLLGIGMLVLGLAPTAAGAVVAGVIMGIGNGMSSGTMLTLGGDLAPPRDPGPFMAALGVMQDLGVVLGPIVVGWLADTVGIDGAAVALALVMFAAIGWIVVALGDTAHPTRPWLVRRLAATAPVAPP